MTGREHEGCAAIREEIGAFLDGETIAARAEQIRLHLADCPPCLDEMRAEVTVRGLVRRSCAPPVAPDELRVRVVARIRTVSITYRREP